MKRKLFSIFCILFLAVFVSQAGARDVVKLVLMPGVQLFPILNMEAQGLDEKNNITLEKKMVVSPSALYTHLRAGEVDIGFGSWPTIALFRSQGAPLVNVYPMIRFFNEILVKVDSPLKGFSDLKGKRIGLFGGPAAGTSTLFRFICIKYFGFDPVKESKLQYGAPSLLKGLAEKGELDAVMLLDPYATLMLEKGDFKPIGEIGGFYEEKTGTVLLHVCVVANEDFGKKNPDVLKRFLKAFKESVTHLKNHAEAWPPLLAEAVKIKKESQVKLMQKRMTHALFTRWDEALIQQNIEFGEKLGDTLGKKFWHGIPEGTFSFEYSPK